MEVAGRYEEDGYAHLKALIEPEVAQAFLQRLAKDIGRTVLPLAGKAKQARVLARPALEIYGPDYPPMLSFLWGLTPLMSRLVGRELLPTFDFFRVYRSGDVCRVHSDHEACEHSLSLTLGYSEGEAWDLQIGTRALPGRQERLTEDFADEPYVSVAMAVGDAVMYRGIHRRHGRMTPNPNRWSAHLFLHWVERDGPYRGEAYRGLDLDNPAQVNFG
jgi:hypothetical protein